MRQLAPFRMPVVSVFVLLSTIVAACGPQPAIAEAPLHQRIDELIAAGTPDYETIAAPLASDAEFLRRAWLDLAGTTPPIQQTREFLSSEDGQKRAKLIDRLLAGPEYVRHMQQRLDVILMRRLPSKNVSADEWQEFLRTSFAENKPWDQMVREILAADGTDLENRGPARFYLDRGGETNAITRDIGRLFLGADIQCAQCHDHPEIPDYEQQDYYGISAFLVRSYVFKDPKLKKKPVFAEKAEGEAKFQSVFFPSEEKDQAKPQIFEGPAFDDPEMEKDKLYQVKPAKNVRPIPTYSRRQKLARAVASADNRRFARTAANRFWSLLMGRGLVEPVWFDHSDNPPSHPELLELLTDELIAHQFDIKWYLREIALSKTYQRSSRRIVDGQDAEPAPAEAFAQAPVRPLSPSQFARSILEATGEADVHRAALGEKLTEEALHKRLAGIRNRIASPFAHAPGEYPTDFDSRVDQVLFLLNDPAVLNLVKRKKGNLVDRLANMPPGDPKAIAEELFLSALSRPPTDENVNDVEDYLKGLEGEQRVSALEETVWALVTSTEFRFNH